MLETIRSFSKTWVAKIIFILVAFSFIFFGFGSFSLLSSSKDALVFVNEETITQLDLQRQIQIEKQRYAQMLEGMEASQVANLIDQFVDPQSILNNLIDRSLLEQWIAQLSLKVSKGQVIEQLKVIPGLTNEQGIFDDEAFFQLSNRLGYEPQDFLEVLKKDLLFQLVLSHLMENFFISDASIRSHVDTLSHERKVDFFQIHQKDVSVQISDEEVQAIFDADQIRWFTDEKMDIDYAVLDKDMISLSANTISDEAIKIFHEEKVKNLLYNKKVYHIQMQSTEFEELKEVRAKIISGDLSFDKAVKEYSRDLSSNQNKGYIGNITKTEKLFDEDLHRVASELDSKELSEIIESDFGIHLLQVSIEKKDLPFEPEKLRQELFELKVSEVFEQKKALLDQSMDIHDDNFDSFLEAVGLDKHGTQIDPATNHDLLSREFVEKLMHSEDFRNGYYERLELENSSIMVAKLSKIYPREKKAFSSVSTQVRSVLIDKKRQEKIDKLITEARQVEEFSDIELVLSKYEILNSMESHWLSPARSEDVLSPQALEEIYTQVFVYEKESLLSFYQDQATKTLIFYQISDLRSSADISESEKASLMQKYQNEKQSEYLQSLLHSLKSSAKIEYVNPSTEL